MKVICNRGALLEALNVVGNVIAARTPKPVLLCLKLSAKDGTLDLRSFFVISVDPIIFLQPLQPGIFDEPADCDSRDVEPKKE